MNESDAHCWSHTFFASYMAKWSVRKFLYEFLWSILQNATSISGHMTKDTGKQHITSTTSPQYKDTGLQHITSTTTPQYKDTGLQQLLGLRLHNTKIQDNRPLLAEVCTGRNNLAWPVTFRPDPFPKIIFRPGPLHTKPSPAQPVFNLDVTYHMIRIRIKSSHQSQCWLAYIVIKLKKLILKFI